MNCKTCGKEIPVSKYSKIKRYCSNQCQKIDYRKKNTKLGLSTGTVGAIAELIVATDLMRKGYELYRAVSQASSCDLLAIKDGEFYDIEVRTGYSSIDGKRQYTNHKNVKGKYLAVVVYTETSHQIFYTPELNK